MATATKKAPKPKPVRLPKKPSALIRIALEDLAKAERSPKCAIEMDTWHMPDGEGCAVCLAGAVMRSRLGVPDDRDVWPTDLKRHESQLFAINELRQGWVDSAFGYLDLGDSGVAFDRLITPYANDPTAFKLDMRKLAADLEAAGY